MRPKLEASRYWLYTSPHRQLTNYEADYIYNALPQMCYDYIIGQEGNIDDESLHYHLFIEYDHEVMDCLSGRMGPLEGWHCQRVQDDDGISRAREYCMKEGQYEWKHEVLPSKYAIEPRWRPWQTKVLDYIARNPDRKVCCVIDPVGGCGKTFLALWHVVRHRGIYIPVMSYRDVLRAAFANAGTGPYFFDIPRAYPPQRVKDVFAAAETLSGGYSYDDRYQWRAQVTDRRPIVIFTNSNPPVEYLSSDRWIYIYPQQSNSKVIDYGTLQTTPNPEIPETEALNEV